MFAWYCDAAVCYVYLADFSVAHAGNDDLGNSTELEGSSHSTEIKDSIYITELEKCRWFSRGWTLQELIAPHALVFYDAAWLPIGNRASQASHLAHCTGIPERILNRHQEGPQERRDASHVRYDLAECSVAARMSWMKGRHTTRAEDIAYCLLGLFDVNMPLLYGEGSHKAFRRLQMEIIRHIDDQSIFASDPAPTRNPAAGTYPLFADFPRQFGRCASIRRDNLNNVATSSITLSESGVELDTAILPVIFALTEPPTFYGRLMHKLSDEKTSRFWLALLNLHHQGDTYLDRPAMILERLPLTTGSSKQLLTFRRLLLCCANISYTASPTRRVKDFMPHSTIVYYANGQVEAATFDPKDLQLTRICLVDSGGDLGRVNLHPYLANYPPPPRPPTYEMAEPEVSQASWHYDIALAFPGPATSGLGVSLDDRAAGFSLEIMADTNQFERRAASIPKLPRRFEDARGLFWISTSEDAAIADDLLVIWGPPIVPYGQRPEQSQQWVELETPKPWCDIIGKPAGVTRQRLQAILEQARSQEMPGRGSRPVLPVHLAQEFAAHSLLNEKPRRTASSSRPTGWKITCAVNTREWLGRKSFHLQMDWKFVGPKGHD